MAMVIIIGNSPWTIILRNRNPGAFRTAPIPRLLGWQIDTITVNILDRRNSRPADHARFSSPFAAGLSGLLQSLLQNGSNTHGQVLGYARHFVLKVRGELVI